MRTCFLLLVFIDFLRCLPLQFFFGRLFLIFLVIYCDFFSLVFNIVILRNFKFSHERHIIDLLFWLYVFLLYGLRSLLTLLHLLTLLNLLISQGLILELLLMDLAMEC